MANTDIFNQMANKYDSIERIEFAKLVAQELKQRIDDKKYKSLLDFGCATGLVSELVIEDFKQVILLDTASEMLEIAEDKLKLKQIKNYQIINIDLEQNDKLALKVDVILLSQVLLHIPNYLELIIKLRANLNSNGKLIIIDFMKNERVNSHLVHNGFNVASLKKELINNGFQSVKSDIIYEDEKMFMGSDTKVFLLEAKK